MKFKRIDVPSCKRFVFANLSDLHCGSRACAYDDFVADLEHLRLLNSRHNMVARFILGGDQIDGVCVKDKRFSGDDVAFEFRNDLDDLIGAATHKVTTTLKSYSRLCLGILQGNHERSANRDGLIDYTKMMARMSNVDFLTYCAQVRVSCGDTTLRDILVHHGYAGGRQPGNVINKVLELGKQFHDVGVVMMGHSHSVGCSESVTLGFDDQGFQVTNHLLGVVTGSYLHNYVADKTAPYSNYSERAAYSPPSTKTPAVVFDVEEGTYSYINDLRSL